MTKAERISAMLAEHPELSFGRIAKLAHVSRQWVADVAGRFGIRSAVAELSEYRKLIARRGVALCGKCNRELPIADMAKRGKSGIIPTRCNRCRSAKKSEES